MKQATILEILAGMQREIDELQDAVKALQSRQITASVTNPAPPPGGGGPGSEESGNGP